MRLKGIAELFGVSASKLQAVDCPKSFEAIDRDAQQAIKKAEQARSSLQKFNDMLSSKIGMNPVSSVIIGPVKAKERIIQKAIARYDGNVSEVSDVSRSRIRIDNPSQVKSTKDALSSLDFRKDLERKGIRILQIEDCFENPKETGWRGIVIKTEIDLGKGRTQKAETIITPTGWFPSYETTHTYLENIRKLKDLAKAQYRELSHSETMQIEQYKGMAKEIHDGLAKRDGYDILESKHKHQQPSAEARNLAL